MDIKYLPDHWKKKIKEHALEISLGERESFEYMDFDNNINVKIIEEKQIWYSIPKHYVIFDVEEYEMKEEEK